MSVLVHIAVIDDDEAVLDSLRLYFGRQSIEATCFKSAKDFLAAIGSGQRFDCIVSDVRMPGMSGLDLVHRLKGDGLAAPVILITGMVTSIWLLPLLRSAHSILSRSRSMRLGCLPASAMQ